jgi:hypothetical protein
MIRQYFGGAVADVEKSPTNNDDDEMCWAAAASNVLEWTGWGQVRSDITNADQMFAYYQKEWPDMQSNPATGLRWWFNGNASISGGRFHPDNNVDKYLHHESDSQKAMDAVAESLHAGRGTTLSLVNTSGDGHAVTCWGVELNSENHAQYVAIHITDSDDDKSLTNPTDRLRRYRVEFNNGRWLVSGYGSGTDWYIRGVTGLDRKPPPASSAALFETSRLVLKPAIHQSTEAPSVARKPAESSPEMPSVNAVARVAAVTLDGETVAGTVASPADEALAVALDTTPANDTTALDRVMADWAPADPLLATL